MLNIINVAYIKKVKLVKIKLRIDFIDAKDINNSNENK